MPAGGPWASSCATTSAACSAEQPPRRGGGSYVRHDEASGQPDGRTRLPRPAAGASWGMVCGGYSFPSTGCSPRRGQRPWGHLVQPQPTLASSLAAMLTSSRGQRPRCRRQTSATRPAHPPPQTHTRLTGVVAAHSALWILLPSRGWSWERILGRDCRGTCGGSAGRSTWECSSPWCGGPTSRQPMGQCLSCCSTPALSPSTSGRSRPRPAGDLGGLGAPPLGKEAKP